MAQAFERHAGIDLLATIAGGQGDRVKLAAAAAKYPASRRPPDDDLGRYLQPHSGRAGRAKARHWARRRYCMSTRCRWRRWRGQKPGSEKSPNVSSFMPAASNSPMPSANSPTRRATRALRERRWPRSSASMASAIRWTRIFWPRWPHMPPASRHRAGLRSAGHAGDRRRAIEQVMWTPVAESHEEGRMAMTQTLRTAEQLRRARTWRRPVSCRRSRRSPRATRWRCRRRLPALIDRNDPHDPIARQFVPRRRELDHRAERACAIRSATTRTARSKASCIAIPTACCSS